MQLVLASASEWRAKLLELFEVPFEVVVSGFDEQVVVADEAPDLVMGLAMEKARIVTKQLDDEGCYDCLVIGADTVIDLDGEIIGKPKNKSEAKQIIDRLQGRSHRVVSGICVWSVETREHEVRVDETWVHLLSMTKAQIDAYIETNEWKGKAGGYQIQRSIAKYVATIEGRVSTIIGLPLLVLEELLEHYGYQVDVSVVEIENSLRSMIG